MNAETNLKIIVLIYHQICKLYGLMPFKNSRKIVFYIYSAIVVNVVIYLFCNNIRLPMIYGQFTDSYSQYSKSLISNGYILFEIIFAAIYITQYLTIEKKIKLFYKVFRIRKIIKRNIGSETIFETKNIEFVYVGSVCIVLISFLGVTMQNHLTFLNALCYVAPSSIISILFDTFFGTMILIALQLRQLNKKIKVIVQKTFVLREMDDKKMYTKYQCAQYLHSLSDELDIVSAFYTDICNFALEFNKVWSFQTLLFCCFLICAYCMHFYAEFLIIRFSLNHSKLYGTFHIMIIFITFALIWCMFKMVICCQMIYTQVN